MASSALPQFQGARGVLGGNVRGVDARALVVDVAGGVRVDVAARAGRGAARVRRVVTATSGERQGGGHVLGIGLGALELAGVHRDAGGGGQGGDAGGLTHLEGRGAGEPVGVAVAALPGRSRRS